MILANSCVSFYRSTIDSGMAKVPSPIKRMDTSAESSSSGETDETSDSESEDSSSGSQHGGDKSENAAPQLSVAPSTVSYLIIFELITDNFQSPFLISIL